MKVLYFFTGSMRNKNQSSTLDTIMTPISLSTKTVNKALVENMAQTITCQKHRVAVVSTVGQTSD